MKVFIGQYRVRILWLMSLELQSITLVKIYLTL